jgi:hypothetical protein
MLEIGRLVECYGSSYDSSCDNADSSPGSGARNGLSFVAVCFIGKQVSLENNIKNERRNSMI